MEEWKMFYKLDKPLFITRILLIIITCIFIIGSIIAGIVLCCMDNDTLLIAGLVLIFCGPLWGWLTWITGQLVLSLMCDIKLIRNKLYGMGIENFKPFYIQRERFFAPATAKVEPVSHRSTINPVNAQTIQITPSNIKVGMEIVHAKYGEGKIVSKNDYCVHIAFSSGEKEFSISAFKQNQFKLKQPENPTK